MTEKEIARLDTITRLNEKQLTRAQAAEILGISIRQTQRILNRYRSEGVAGLISKKRGQPSNRRLPTSIKEHALYLIKTHYADFGPTLACEKLNEQHDIDISIPTLRNWMIDNELWIPRKHQKRVHQPRHRREHRGELIQIDGSDHYWFEDRGPRCTLLVFIDDATSQLMELRFVESESTFDYFHSTKRYLQTYGKPVAFYSDKHSIFRVNKQGATSGNGMTQFGRALHELNIDIICANTSQAKGRVERANRTLQDRLVKELRLHNINSLEEGNAYLDEFMKDFNRRFAKPPLQEKDLHRKLTSDDHLDDILTWQEERTVTKNLTVQYDKVVYLIKPSDATLNLMRKKVRIYDYPDGSLDIRYKGLSLPYSSFDKVRQVKQGEIVSNKRLDAALKFAREKQKESPIERSKKAPKRRGQKQTREQVKTNTAAIEA